MNKLYVSRSGDGHLNLAVDEYLLDLYRGGSCDGITLYFFVNDSAVIIGRNQNAWRECDLSAMEEDGVQLVRRHTGGGAVFHDSGNLNFSFIANEKLYDKDRLTSIVLRAVARLGLKPEANGRNDLLIEGRKFSGCAYGLSGAARAMHGTLLISADFKRLSRYLRPSVKKLAAKGISSVRSRVANITEFASVSVERMRELITEEFVREYGEAEELVLDPEASESIVRLAEKHRSWDWRFGRTPEFDWSLDDSFSFGDLQLFARVRNGVVASAEAYSDSLSVSAPAEIARLIEGVRFDETELANALKNGGPEAREVADYIGFNALAESTREALHSIPELALHENKTKAFIKDFILNHTSLELHDEGEFIYAVHREDGLPALAVRADFDAVPCGNGAAHLCGHDGHTAALLCLALLLEGRTVGKSVILLFQPAEETGEGAPLCAPLFEKERISAVIGTHNIPSRPEGEIQLKRGTFACASCGIELTMIGAPTHAAYPENGKNPSSAIAKLALRIPEKAAALQDDYGCMTLATIVGMRTGKRAFGVAASEGRLWVTLRSESTEALEQLRAYAESEAGTLAEREGLALSITVSDPFPATVNDPELLDSIESVCTKRLIPCRRLEEPFRWSEDFGHYAKYAPACFFGIGSGVDTAPLHTAEYEYPSGLAASAGRTLFDIVKELKIK